MKIPGVIALLFLISSAHAGARQDAKVLMDPVPEEANFQADWGYASAIRVGDTIYLSGVVAGVRAQRRTSRSATNAPSRGLARR